MKNTIFNKLAFTFCILISVIKINGQCAAGFNYTLNPNGNVSFLSTTTSASLATTYYTWDFGDNTSIGFSQQTAPSHNYSNGTYTVVLCIANYTPTYCADTISQVITVTSSPCNINLNPSFTYFDNGLGNINFTSTSTNTTSNTVYTWDFGDANGGSGNPTSHTYSASNTYTVKLLLTDGACTDSTSNSYFINTTPCVVMPSFSYSLNTLYQNYLFTNTSSNTSASTTYTWNMGDGNFLYTNTTNNYFSYGYATAGIYTVTLLANNNPSVPCIASTSQTINAIATVTVPCTLAANYNYNLGSGGSVSFNDASVGTNSNTIYTWDYGDGNNGYGQNPTNIYASAGTYSVTLYTDNQTFVPCLDTMMQTISVTGIPCIANSSFSMIPTATAQVWNAVPLYPWNIVAVDWSWGDNSSSNVLYASHSYSTAGTYSICLSVTVSCGTSSSTCMTPFIFKTANNENMQMVHVNVVAPTSTLLTQIKKTEAEMTEWSIYPNPNNGQFELKMKNTSNETIKIKVYNLVGGIVYETEIVSDDKIKKINMDGVSNGIYFIKASVTNKEYTKKVVINK